MTPPRTLTRFDRVTRAVALIVALPLIVFALPFLILGLLLVSIAGLLLWAAGFNLPKAKGDAE